MRGYIASSIGVTCATVLSLSIPLPAAAAGPGVHRPSVVRPLTEAVPGSTQSLPLVPLNPDRVAGTASEAGLAPQSVRSFSLVGVVWDDPGTELYGHVQIRTRASGTDQWSDWQEVETHNQGHGPDPASDEGRSYRMRGSTAPLWVGESDGVEVRVRAEADHTGGTRAPTLPDGLRVELVDPGAEPPSDVGAPSSQDDSVQRSEEGAYASETGAGAIASAVGAGLAPLNAAVLPALSKEAAKDVAAKQTGNVLGGLPVGAQPYVAPRPSIITRSGWGADESLREAGFVYTGSVKAAFVHHTASGNNYTCSQAPSVIRSIYRYHVVSSGWRDIGYNFLIDKCGNIYEGRAGGVDKPVMGAHTLGFNTNSTGIAVLGTYTSTEPSAAAVNAVAALTAWKFGLSGIDPRGTTYLTSGGGNLYPKGVNVRLNVISGHRDGFATECPGKLLYGKLGSARSTAARLQGR
ncbi:peptidoglycan recognition protein family protein [Streptomyces chiangmaiensis]|uniref:N-acetylmuramoyl-L-alanine amidase n=1 Tax=Streptomyces chiangmaiensis TaxID=766497 RepID=A0ABU7FG11_9ACTN|nr:N-acetylmuramoyl-L-alanine amidase [Streptomyces chiangmaiensis]MED7823003.1 N-acetylmuramoyl-L-alanine amidase [Streptomyces chiangmaiensis]